jgi:hypothetical protein
MFQTVISILMMITDPNQITTIEGAGYYPQAGISWFDIEVLEEIALY